MAASLQRQQPRIAPKAPVPATAHVRNVTDADATFSASNRSATRLKRFTPSRKPLSRDCTKDATINTTAADARKRPRRSPRRDRRSLELGLGHRRQPSTTAARRMAAAAAKPTTNALPDHPWGQQQDQQWYQPGYPPDQNRQQDWPGKAEWEEEQRKQREEQEKQQNSERAMWTLKQRFPGESQKTLERFLTARKDDADAASEMLGASLRWSRAYGFPVEPTQIAHQLAQGTIFSKGKDYEGTAGHLPHWSGRAARRHAHSKSP